MTNRFELGERTVDALWSGECGVDVLRRHAFGEQSHLQIEFWTAPPQRTRTGKAREIEEVCDRLRPCVTEAARRIGDDLRVDDATDPARTKRAGHEVALGRS